MLLKRRMSLKDAWQTWWEVIESKGLLSYPVGKIAAEHNLRWPSTRYMEPISLYRFRTPSHVRRLEGFGTVKYHIIVECVRLLAEGGNPRSGRWTRI